MQKLITTLQAYITPSVIKNKTIFQKKKDYIYIISGGFKEYIIPIVQEFGIEPSHVLANTFIYDQEGNVVGFDKTNPLATDSGKTEAVKKLALKGKIIAIGDGYTDYLLKKNGVAKKFFAFTENVTRTIVTEKADDVLFNFDELFFLYGSSEESSTLKTGPLAVILGQPYPNLLNRLEENGFQVIVEEKNLEEKSLYALIKNATVLIVDSRTPVTHSLLRQATKLLVIGRLGLTTAKIDLAACTKNGIAVFNAPFTNIRSVAELVLGEIIMLFRHVCIKNEQLHKNIWDKKVTESHEVRGKILGIIGYDGAGMQLSLLAESLGMRVFFYDKDERAAIGNAKACQSMEEVLRIADVISVHIEGNQVQQYPLTKKEFLFMKDGAFFINLSSGYMIDETLIASQLQSGKLGGVAIDVFTKEPKHVQDHFSSPLQKFPNAILTPGIGGITEEATTASGEFVIQKIIQYLSTGTTLGSVNFPQLSLPDHPHTHRFLHIHENIPGMLARITAIMAQHEANIEGQYLKTNESIGYVITDATTKQVETVLRDLQNIPATIRVREVF